MKKQNGSLFNKTDDALVIDLLALSKIKMKAKKCYIFLCNRELAKKKIHFDIFSIDNFKKSIGEIFYDLEKEKWGHIWEEFNDENLFDIIKECYLRNINKMYMSVGYAFSISSSIGCLGVAFFYDIESGQYETRIHPASESITTQLMSTLGHAILSKLSHDDYQKKLQYKKYIEDDITSLIWNIDDKVKQFGNYIPFSKRECVTLFVDTRGFSKIQAKWKSKPNSDRNELHFLIRLQNLFENIANDHYGIVVDFWGGGAFIIFNILLYENLYVACHRALCAAKRIKENVLELFKVIGNSQPNNRSLDINLGIGSNVGDVRFFGFKSNGGAHNYRCVGEKVSETKKIERFSGRSIYVYDEEMAYKTPHDKEDHIIISSDFYELIRGYNCGKNIIEMGFPNSLYDNTSGDGLYGFNSSFSCSCENVLKCQNSTNS